MSQFYDVIVVGAGNAALCAAISAREKNENVLVLEKGPSNKRGGNSYFTDGAIRFAYKGLDAIRKIIPSISDDEASKIVMPEYDAEDYYQDLMRVTNNKSEPSLARQLVYKSYETIEWMSNNGIKFDLIYDNQSFEKEGKFHFWGGLPVKIANRGIGLIDMLNKRVDEQGITVWYDSPAKELITEKGKVTGVVVEKDGETLSIGAKSVILACGSFEANIELRMKHMGEEWGNAILRGTEYNTGDGLQMAIDIGANIYGQWSGCHSIGTDFNTPKVGDFTKPGDIFKKSSYPLGLILNKDGKRFVDEGEDLRNYTYAKYGREILKQPDYMAYQVFDSQTYPFLRSEYKIEETTVYSAPTLEELAEKIDIDKNQFLETIMNYNDAVQEGEFHPSEKDGKCTKGIEPPKSNWALKLDQGPFYAFPVICGITFAFGGLHVNEKAQVLNVSGEPIEGLFAAGEMVGGIFYDNYPGGSGLMSGAVFGKIAGNSAAEYALA